MPRIIKYILSKRNMKINLSTRAFCGMTVIPTLGKPNREDYWKLEASLIYILSFRRKKKKIKLHRKKISMRGGTCLQSQHWEGRWWRPVWITKWDSHERERHRQRKKEERRERNDLWELFFDFQTLMYINTHKHTNKEFGTPLTQR